VLLRKSGVSSSALIWAAVVFTAAGAVWALVAPLGETIPVAGKLQPSGSVLRVDAPVPGLVEAVLVKEGQQVNKGEALIRFDLREPRSSLKAAESVRARLLNEIQINRAALGEIDARGLSGNQQQQLVDQQQDLLSSRRASEEELRKSEEELRGLNTTLTTAENIANRYQELRSTGAVSEVQVLEAVNRGQELRSRRSVTEREVARLRAVLQGTRSSRLVELRRRIEENLARVSDLDRDISLARQRLQYGVLTAPVPGRVFDISVAAGSVVQPAQPEVSKALLKIVPENGLEARVYIPNTAIGFVRVGQRADISLDTFPSADYGRIKAVVTSIGSDALSPSDLNQALGSQVQGLYFPAMLRLGSQRLKLSHGSIALQAGMSLTADITLRERRFISIFTGFFSDKRRDLERLR
jgi:HlyD family secretion protein